MVPINRRKSKIRIPEPVEHFGKVEQSRETRRTRCVRRLTMMDMKMAPPEPQKKALTKRKIANKTRTPYARMILRAVRDEQEEDNPWLGRGKIGKYILANYPVSEIHLPRYLTAALLKACTEDKTLVYKKGRGYRLSAKTAAKRSVSSKKRVASTKIKGPAKKKSRASPKKVTKASPKRKAKTASKPKISARKKATTKKEKVSARKKLTEVNVETSAQGVTLESSGAHWEYFHNGWRKYDNEASAVVEEAYQEYLQNPSMLDVRAVQSGHDGWRYQVDFINLSQTNIDHQAHTTRDIRRIEN